MSEEERKALLERIQASTEAARRMTPDQARQRLQQEGFCDENGRLLPAYGGLEIAEG